MSLRLCRFIINVNKTTITMMNAAKKTTRKTAKKAALLSIIKKAEKEQSRTEQMFGLLGWGELPAELKFVIAEDVKGYIDELEGSYSTSCGLVQRRRESVDFWVKSYMDNLCSLETAVDALKITRL